MSLSASKAQPLVAIAKPAFDVEQYIAYATSDNFTGKPVYKQPKCYLHPEAAHCLNVAIDLAARQHLRILIYDAYRPTEAQQLLWDHTPDPDFLAPPEHGSPHSRGVAVDLTLIDDAGEVLDMGTGFDAFTPLSHHGNIEVSPAAQRNRLLLMGIMTTAGWDFYRNEWWHYQLFNSREYPLLSNEESKSNIM